MGNNCFVMFERPKRTDNLNQIKHIKQHRPFFFFTNCGSFVTWGISLQKTSHVLITLFNSDVLQSTQFDVVRWMSLVLLRELVSYWRHCQLFSFALAACSHYTCTNLNTQFIFYLSPWLKISWYQLFTTRIKKKSSKLVKELKKEDT